MLIGPIGAVSESITLAVFQDTRCSILRPTKEQLEITLSRFLRTLTNIRLVTLIRTIYFTIAQLCVQNARDFIGTLKLI